MRTQEKMYPQKENIIIFPFMAQGHIIPFLSLALKLEQQTNHTITFINTPLNINKLKQTLPPNSTIRLLELPFDSTKHGLPPNTETTETLTAPLIGLFIESSAVALKPAFRNLISSENNPPLCIISDMFLAWTADIAHEFNAFHTVFIAGGGFGMASWAATCLNTACSVESNPNESEFLKNYKIFETKNLPEMPETPWEYGQEIYNDWKKTDAMLFNTMEEFDGIGLTYFRENFPNCSVFAIGPIMNKARGEGWQNRPTNQHPSIMEWLDSKPKRSVLYIAFGSQNSPSETKTLELAKALEASNVNFLWVFRAPTGFTTHSSSDNNNTKAANKGYNYFPAGFKDRMNASGKGLLVESWAPQAEILAHETVGAFLSHCGWNSVVEALSNGVPMLTWPMGADQPFNARFLEEEIGACVGVADGEVSDVKYEELVKKIELIMKGGHVMRRKACDVREMIQNATYDEGGCKGSSVEAMERFVNTFLKTRKGIWSV